MTNIRETLLEYWRKQIQRDLAPFADPNTQLEITGDGNRIAVVWYLRDELKYTEFRISAESGVEVSFLGQKLSYKAFFASEQIADLRLLAKMILRTNSGDLYVPTNACKLDAGSVAGPAIELIDTILNEQTDNVDFTNLVLLIGEAGAGKTSVLRKIVKDRAEKYVNGSSNSLFFYVNAQGRALARFYEALSTELNELRSILPYHGIAVLCRLGILVPIIDGFDELLGTSGGYDDAFNSLSGFIEELNGSGAVVASARSTYYEQEFIMRANRTSVMGAQIWKQTTVEVLLWDNNQRKEYIRQKLGDSNIEKLEEIDDFLDKIFSGDNQGFSSKPFFVARLVDLYLQGKKIDFEGDLLENLTDAYLTREYSEKLLDQQGNPLLSKSQILNLLIEIAEEMWNQETRELDSRPVREIAEYVLATDGTEEHTQRIIMERISNLAFLSPGDRLGSVKFEHELFFSYFLAQKLVERMNGSQNSTITRLLSRSVLPKTASDMFTRQYREKINKNLQDLVSILNKTALNPKVSKANQVRENTGILVNAALLEYCISGNVCNGLEISNHVFPGLDFSGITLRDSILVNLEFRRSDFTKFQVFSSIANSVFFHEVRVDRQFTKLEIPNFNPNDGLFGIIDVRRSTYEPIFDPRDLDEILQDIGLISRKNHNIPRRDVSDEVVKLINDFVRAYRTRNPICLSDQFLNNIFSKPQWPAIRRALEESNIVKLEYRPSGGNRTEFLRRLVRAEDILQGLNPDIDLSEPITRFWNIMESNFPR